MNEETGRSIAEVIDLTAAANELLDSHRSLAFKIRRFSDVHSAHTDLDNALDMVNSVASAVTLADKGEEWAKCAIQALTYSAVILYVRATKSSSKHRGVLDLSKQFNPAEAEFHKHLCDLRDDAIAHFGPGAMPNGSAWHEERALWPLDRIEDARMIVVSKRIGYDPNFVRDLSAHIRSSMLLAQRKLEDAELVLHEALDPAMEDPAVVSTLRHCKIQRGELFGSASIGRMILGGDRVGMKSATISEG